MTVKRSQDGQHSKRRVLVADDRRDARHLTKCLLESLGHDVAVASSGGEALALVREFAPDVVLCDVLMPDMDGFEVARRIRRDFPDVILVAVTGDGHEDLQQQASDAGFDRLLVKPTGVDALQELLAAGSDVVNG